MGKHLKQTELKDVECAYCHAVFQSRGGNVKYKEELALKHGYKIMYVWEMDYNIDPRGVEQRCVDFIKNN